MYVKINYQIPTDRTASYSVNKLAVSLGSIAIKAFDVSELEAAPAGAVDSFLKGPDSLYVTSTSGLKKMPDSIKAALPSSDVIYDWTLPGSSGKFLYRQDLR
jgi:hypothetical protein